MEMPFIDYSKCRNSQTCIRVCPAGVFDGQGEKAIVSKPKKCMQCRACEVSCPNSAVRLMDAKEARKHDRV